MAVIMDGLMVWRVHWDSMGVASTPVIVVWSIVMWSLVSMHGMELVSSHIRVVISVVVVVMIHWLHLQYQIAARGVDVGWVED